MKFRSYRITMCHKQTNTPSTLIQTCLSRISADIVVTIQLLQSKDNNTIMSMFISKARAVRNITEYIFIV